MDKRRTYSIDVKDSVFDPNVRYRGQKRDVYYFRKDDKVLFKVFLFVDGKDIDFVEKVEYTLHSTFKNNHKTVYQTLENPKCSLTIWTWGLFEVHTKIHFSNGFVWKITHNLSYDEQLRKLQEEKKLNYVKKTKS